MTAMRNNGVGVLSVAAGVVGVTLLAGCPGQAETAAVRWAAGGLARPPEPVEAAYLTPRKSSLYEPFQGVWVSVSNASETLTVRDNQLVFGEDGRTVVLFATHADRAGLLTCNGLMITDLTEPALVIPLCVAMTFADGELAISMSGTADAFDENFAKALPILSPKRPPCECPAPEGPEGTHFRRLGESPADAMAAAP